MAASIASMEKQRDALEKWYEAGTNADGNPLNERQMYSLFLDINSLTIGIELAKERKARRDSK